MRHALQPEQRRGAQAFPAQAPAGPGGLHDPVPRQLAEREGGQAGNALHSHPRQAVHTVKASGSFEQLFWMI